MGKVARNQARHGVDSAVAERIGALADRYPSRKLAASAAGVSTDQLRRYIGGENAAPFEAMARLADGVEASLDWLATGETHAAAEIDERLLTDCIRALEEELAARGLMLATDKKARVIALCYRLFRDKGAVRRDDLSRILDLAA